MFFKELRGQSLREEEPKASHFTPLNAALRHPALAGYLTGVNPVKFCEADYLTGEL